MSPKDRIVLAEERSRELRPIPLRSERQVREAMAKVEPRCPHCLGELKTHVNQGVLIGFTCLECGRSVPKDQAVLR